MREGELLVGSQDSLFTTANTPEIFYWQGGSGFWDDTSHWSTGKLPGATDEVVIDVPEEVTITYRQDSASIAKLTTQENLVIVGGDLTIIGEGAFNNDLLLSGGRLNTSGVVTLKGQQNQWSGGTIAGTGSVNIAADASLNITNGYYKYLSGDITLNNAGTVIWDGDNYYIYGDYSANDTINNQGIFEIKNDAGIYYLNFQNSGTLIKSGTEGSTTFYYSPFNNTGNVDLRKGKLSFIGGGSSNGGTFKLASDTTAQWSNGYTFDANTTFTGDGTIEISGGDVNLNEATVNLNGLVVNGGSLNTTGNVNLNKLNLSGGRLNTSGVVTLKGQQN